MIDLMQNVKRELKGIDAGLAKHYLTFNNYPYQRRLRSAHVRNLTLKIKNHHFTSADVTFAKCLFYEGKVLLVDGQHVLNAIIDANRTVPGKVVTYEVQTEKDLASLFMQFETLSRSLLDMVEMKSGSMGLSWPTWVSSLIVSGGALELSSSKSLNPISGVSSWSTSRPLMTKEDKTNLLEKYYLNEGKFVSDILTINNTKRSKKTVKHIARTPIVMVMMRTYQMNENDAGIFWVRLRDGESLKKTMPEHALRDFLLRANSLKEYRLKPTNHEYAYRCIKAWNDFRLNKFTRLHYRLDSAIPKLI